MTPGRTRTAEKTKSVKADRDRAPSGPGKDAALEHYKAAGKAHKAKPDAEPKWARDKATERFLRPPVADTDLGRPSLRGERFLNSEAVRYDPGMPDRTPRGRPSARGHET